MTPAAAYASAYRARVLHLRRLTLRAYRKALCYPADHHKAQHHLLSLIHI